MSEKIKYQYNYGVACYLSGDIYKAKAVFGQLRPQAQGGRRICYAYGACCALTEETKTAHSIAGNLAVDVLDDYISSSEIADLYFLCDDYEKHNKMYDNDRYEINASWIEPYLYSCKGYN